MDYSFFFFISYTASMEWYTIYMHSLVQSLKNKTLFIPKFFCDVLFINRVIAGFLVFVSWQIWRQYWNPFQILVLSLSFLLTIFIMQKFDNWSENAIANTGGLLCKHLFLKPIAFQGRIWLVPENNSLMKNGSIEMKKSELIVQQGLSIIIRYIEYAITSPLLLTSVCCLLIVDAPAWVYICCYFFMIVCNLYGILLHSTVVIASLNIEKTDNVPGDNWFMNIITTGKWYVYSYTSDFRFLCHYLLFTYRRSRWVNKFYYMEGAWICMSISILIIGYIVREILFTSRIPVIVLIIIWNLLVSYCLFGIIPTYWYFVGDINHHLELSLDILNIAAKFTLPLYILIGFITMPSGGPVC